MMDPSDNYPARRYAPVGQCIYCGRANERLTDEHPIPVFLGGLDVLPAASCEACAKITCTYEGVTARTTLGNMRMRLGFPTRRKKSRPTQIEIGTIDDVGRRGRRMVPVKEYPVGAILPSFGRAGIFVDAPPWVDITQPKYKIYGFSDIDEFQHKYNWDGVVKHGNRTLELAQTLIKICYSLTVAELGANAFEPICLPQILGRDNNYSFLFGQNGQNELSRDNRSAWNFRIKYIVPDLGPILLYTELSIFPGFGTPIYEVALGFIQTDDQIQLFQKHLADNIFVYKP